MKKVKAVKKIEELPADNRKVRNIVRTFIERSREVHVIHSLQYKCKMRQRSDPWGKSPIDRKNDGCIKRMDASNHQPTK